MTKFHPTTGKPMIDIDIAKQNAKARRNYVAQHPELGAWIALQHQKRAYGIAVLCLFGGLLLGVLLGVSTR